MARVSQRVFPMRPSLMSTAVSEITMRETTCMTDCLADGGAGAPGTSRRASHVTAPLRTLARLLVLALAIVAAMLLAGVSSALAQPPHSNYTYRNNFTDASALVTAERLAVDPGNANLLVTDAGQNFVSVFQPGPDYTLTHLEDFGAGTLSQPVGIAIDAVSHKVYVADAGNSRIVRFSYTVAATPTYTLDPTFSSPLAGSGPGQLGTFAVALAVDPTTHQVLVADTVNQRVDRFSATGVFVSALDGSNTAAGAFAHLIDLAVAPSGEVAVVDAAADFSAGRVERFSPSGAALGRVPVTLVPSAVTYEPTSGMLLVGENAAPGTAGRPLVAGFIAGVPTNTTETADFSSVPDGLAVDPGGTGQLYGVFGGDFSRSVAVFSAAQAPGVSINAPTAVTSTSADVSGTVDAGGLRTTPHFEYSTDGQTWTALPNLPDLTGSGAVAVSDHLSGLDPFQNYRVRLVAANDATQSVSPDVRLSTVAAAPAVQTLPPTDVTMTGAEMYGTINAFGQATTYHFEYGSDTSYGLRVPVGRDVSAGVGRAPRPVSAPLSGLQPGVTYHYRLVAENATGTTAGGDQLFTTALGSSQVRGYEQVSPVDKSTSAITESIGFQAAAQGDGAMWETHNARGDTPSDGGAPGEPHYAAFRADPTWLSSGMEPPLTIISDGAARELLTEGVSDDLRHSLVFTNRALVAGAVEGKTNIYLRDTVSHALQLIGVASADAANPDALFSSLSLLHGASADWSTVVVSSPDPLTSDPVPPGSTQLYAYHDGHTKLVSILPDGSPSGGVQLAGKGLAGVSADGTRIVFSTGDGAYLRQGDTTVAISVSHRAGDPSTVQPAQLVASSTDGRFDYFVSTSATPLTDDAPAGAGALYRYDADQRSLSYVDHSANPFTAAQFLTASPDGSTVYFTYYLVGSADDGLWAWRGGPAVHLSSDFDAGSLEGGPSSSANSLSVSPDGRYLAVNSFKALTARSLANPRACSASPVHGSLPGTCPTVYRFDVQADDIVCVSCSPDGSPPAGISGLGPGTLGNYHGRIVGDDGRVFFDTPNALVAGDANGSQDVYEFADGQPHLISRAAPNTSSRIADSSASGNDVFFYTDDRLVGQDQDAATDVYDARIGGGLAGQMRPVPDAACGGVECREPSPGQPAGAAAATDEALPGNAPPAGTPRAHLSVVRASVGHTTVLITVKASVRGRLRASGPRVSAAVRELARAGSYSLSVPLSKSAKRLRARHRAFAVRVRITLTPPFGSAAVTTVARTARK
jgi:DNA-binding beta-propeller fold protein YncE